MTQHSRPARFARLRVFLTALCFAGTADVLAAPMVYVPDSSTGKIAIVDPDSGFATKFLIKLPIGGEADSMETVSL